MVWYGTVTLPFQQSYAPPLFSVGASLFSDEGVTGDWLSQGDKASAMYGMLEATPIFNLAYVILFKRLFENS